MTMAMILPPGLTAQRFAAALREFERVLGAGWVLATDADRESYGDAHAPGDGSDFQPAAAIAPADCEQLRALLAIANAFRVPLWPVSRGKNLGYGGSAPALAGSVVLDLSRLKRILEVDEQCGYCVVEPGVTFFDLAAHLREHRIALWMAVPATGWGSLIGNALDRGTSATPYGEHAASICGMEVMLPDGQLLRTGMGAMRGGASWQLARNGFGPSWEQVFVQSNFGIVTRMGLWLMPEPESTLAMSLPLAQVADLAWAVDTLGPLRLRGTLQQDPALVAGLRALTLRAQRDQWYRGAGAMPEEQVQALLQRFDLGAWNLSLRLYGSEAVVSANASRVQQAFAAHTSQQFRTHQWRQGEGLAGSGAGMAGLDVLGNLDWRGGRGAHLSFAPLSPPGSAHALRQYRLARQRHDEFGFDYLGAFNVRERHLVHSTLCIFDRDDAGMTRNARDMFAHLIDDHAQHGYGEQRTHLRFMDQVARSYDFGDHALLRLNERFKDLVDPNGILAPGKSGIWPRGLRS